ncbi:phage virion morphogenesis protein [Stenotrophomonas maltophilia]|jgi:phage virion morphogenesis protein|uniref:phage virion morphogenesis protein n=1 Tax=Stenotrophomonas maltophilia TaxID=40324 RepID=UPI001312D481|nr:phage virion morphogenesis protein [Stenotrophomonas maltophilia]MBA0423915.1 phage virion morphogenesis protein [Stenotrophomonas maltophilia]MBN5006721.1 phage virion morphogenesis protein [Stenotrophomonas maltophilia]
MALLEVTLDSATPGLADALRQLEGEARQLILKDWGEYLLGSTRRRGKQQVDPSGRKWRALSPSYKRYKQRKRPGRPILEFDFHMLGDMASWQLDGSDAVLVGTNAPYGAIHQGGGTISRPARSTHVHMRTGKGGSRFVKASRQNQQYRRRVTLPAYTITIAARPWLGVSREDEKELLDIAQDHLSGAFE